MDIDFDYIKWYNNTSELQYLVNFNNWRNMDWKLFFIIVFATLAYAYIGHKVDVYIYPIVRHSARYCFRLLREKCRRCFK